MKKLFYVLILIPIIIFLISILFNDSSNIEIAGSSTVYPITLEAEYSYLKTNKNLRVNVESNGTGNGFDLFTKGYTAINDASRKITNDEKIQAQKNNVNYDEYKIGHDGITVIVNPQNKWISNLSLKQLNQIFYKNSNIVNWNDINPSWPDKKITLYGPTSSSGTYDYFCDKISDNSDNCSLNTQINGTENDNEIISNVSKDKYGIGFLGYAFYDENKDKVKGLKINNIESNSKNITKGIYPISRPLYIYVNTDMLKQNKELYDFVRYYINNSQSLVTKSGYIAITDDELNIDKNKLKNL